MTMIAMLATAFVACNKHDDKDSLPPEKVSAEDNAVDLGLTSGTKWAKMNVGATSAWDKGDYFAWGETTPKESYTWSNYLHLTGEPTEEDMEWLQINKYQIEDAFQGIWYSDVKFVGDNKTTLDPEDDAATANWGGDWTTPTKEDFAELLTYCEYDDNDSLAQSLNGVSGCLLTASNGNTIFFPHSGVITAGFKQFDGYVGVYWMNNLARTGDASELWSISNVIYAIKNRGIDAMPDNAFSRCFGIAVRPVCKAGGNTNGHDAVDLGLPSGKLWGVMNVGAQKAEDYGYYLAWGETEPKEFYIDSTYKYVVLKDDGTYSYNKYQIEDDEVNGVWYDKDFVGDGKSTLEAGDDAAVANWGGKWKTPTQEQAEELVKECYWLWTDNYADSAGVSGYIVYKAKSPADKGKIVFRYETQLDGYSLDDTHIFMPHAGFYANSRLVSSGHYWLSSLRDTRSANVLIIPSDYRNYENRCYGMPVRPVCE